MRSVLSLLYNVFLLVAAAYHIWTCYIAFKITNDIIPAFLSLLAPVLSEAYWIYQVWGREDFQWYIRAGFIIAIVGIIFTVLERD